MKEYVIEKTVGAPDWTKVPELQVDNVCWLPDAGVRMEQQICHDDEKIYVHQVAHEKNIRANCFKCGDFTVQPHYMMWNETTSETPDFHRPQDFGRMIFA